MPAQTARSHPPASPSPGTAWGVALGLLAAWIAAGSCGPLAYSFEAFLACSLLIAAAIAVRPQPNARGWIVAVAILLVATVAPLVFISTPYQVPLLIATTLGLLGASKSAVDRRVLVIGGLCVMILVLYRFAQLQIPAIWLATDRVGSSLGHVVGALTGKPLEIGSSLAGLDFLVVMLTLLIGAMLFMRRPRLTLLLFAGICIILGHAAYLIVLAFTQQITDLLPPVALPLYDNPYIPPSFCWSTILRQLLPWNLPAAGALVHAAIALLILRWTPWSILPEATPAERSERPSPRVQVAITAVPILLAILLPLVGSLRTATTTLEDKRLVANQQEDIDYLLAQHDSYGQPSAGMFGLLTGLTQSLGGSFRTSAALTDEELEQADVLLLLHPNQAIAQQRERIWQYVRAGGSALIVTSGFSPEAGLDNSCNELLRGTAIAVSQDAATSETRDWQEAFAVATHSSMTTTDPRAARSLSDSGASLRVAWGARPLVMGRWGWSAPQQGATWGESHSLESGARLGDLVLAAEQRLGQGRVVVLGSDASLLNEGLVKGYPFVGNLLAYLAQRPSGPQAAWRQMLGLLCCLVLSCQLLRSPTTEQLIAVSVVLSVFLAASQAISVRAARVVPDGQRIEQSTDTPLGNRLAYIDQSHLEAYGLDDWGFDSLNGLPLNLMRNGYVPLMLPGFASERLEKAGMFISIAPARCFSRTERATVREFVERGGVYMCMAGAEQAAASNELLADFGMRVPVSPVPTDANWLEPEPFGRTRALYLKVETPETDDSYEVGVRLHAAWPVEPLDDAVDVLAYGHNQLRVVDSDTELPVIVSREFGRGTVVLIGDTGFALNKNLEYIGGEAFAGGYENANFWRWLLTRIAKQPEWIPPRPAVKSDSDDENAVEPAEGEQ